MISSSVGISVPFAHIISIYIYESGGNLAIWLTTLSLYSLALIYIIFFVKDSRGKRSLPRSSSASMERVESIKTISEIEKKIVSNQSVKNESAGKEKNECTALVRNLFECFVVTFKKREGHQQAVVLILIAAMCLTLLSGCE